MEHTVLHFIYRLFEHRILSPFGLFYVAGAFLLLYKGNEIRERQPATGSIMMGIGGVMSFLLLVGLAVLWQAGALG